MNYVTEIGLLSAVPESFSLEQYILDAGIDVVNNAAKFIPQDLNMFTEPVSISDGMGTNFETGLVHFVERRGKTCIEIPPEKKNQAVDAGSLEYATTEYPVFYRQNKRLFILPEPGELGDPFKDAYPMFRESSTTYSDGTDTFSLTDILITKATKASDASDENNILSHNLFSGDVVEIKYTGDRTSDILTTDGANIIRVSPYVFTIGYKWPGSTFEGELSNVTIVDSDSTNDPHFGTWYYDIDLDHKAKIPASTAHIVKLPSTKGISTDIVNLYFKRKTNNFEYIAEESNSLDNFPEKYDRAVVLFAGAKMCLHNLKLALASDIGLTTAPSIGELDTVTVPSFSLDLTNIPEWDSLDLPIAPTPPGISSITVSAFNNVEEYNAPIMDAPDYSDANNWVNEEEDNEMVSARMSVITAQIQQYSAEVNQASKEFSAKNITYQADVQKKLKDADLELGEENQKLQKYNSELQEYSASIQAETAFSQNKNAEVAQKFQEAVQNTQSLITGYQAEVADASQKNQITLSKYSADLNLYGAQLQEKANKYTWNIQQYNILKNEYVEIFGIPQSQQQAKQKKGGN